MESSVRRPCTLNQPTNCQFRHHRHTHHHHHFQALPQCPLHSYMLYSNNHSPNCSLFTSHNPQNVSSHQLPNNLQSLPPPQPVQTVAVEVRLMKEEWEEDPVFVLTDEWREFFAKSEAKRRQAKKQAKMRQMDSCR